MSGGRRTSISAMNSISGPPGSAAGAPRRPRGRGPARVAPSRGRRGSPGAATTRSSARSRKFVISAGRPAVAANAAANAIVAVAPIAPSYWLPTTTGTLRARQRSRIRRDSVNPVRAVFTLTTRTAPSSSARSTCARLMQLSSPPSGTAQRSREPQPAGAIVGRDRLLDRLHAELDQRVAGAHRVVVAPAAVGVDVEIGVGQRVADRAHRRDVLVRCAPDLDLEGRDPEAPR